MNKPAAILYRCRLCGADFSPVHSPDGPTVLRMILRGEKMPDGWFGVPPREAEVHDCGDRQLGIADLVGVQLDPTR